MKIKMNASNPMFVSGSVGKIQDVKRNAGDRFPVIACEITEIQGSERDVIKSKCSSAKELIEPPFFVEDTSLRIKALGGMPGPYIKYFHTDVLEQALTAFPNKNAVMVSTIGFQITDNECEYFTVECKGKIVNSRGSNGFGFDRIFEPNEGGGLTMAEMTDEQRDAFNPRCIAVRKLMAYIDNNN